MQVFVPFSDFRDVAACLDGRRLCKQIVEAYQIISGRLSPSHRNHPAVLMWKPFPRTLSEYIRVLCQEYENRYGRVHLVREHLFGKMFSDTGKVWFLEGKKWDLLSFSHRVNLLRKMPERYSRFFRVEGVENCPSGYFWAVTASPSLKSAKDSRKWEEWWNGN